MKPMFLILEDGAVFEGRSVHQPPDDELEAAGLLSFYTGVVGYQEVITDPANLGKIIVFTYPLIGNYGVNSQDAESASPKVAGVICKEYPPYYSNFRAEGSLAEYLSPSPPAPLPERARGGSPNARHPTPDTRHPVPFGQAFDTRAILLHLRENGEMKAVVSSRKLSAQEAADTMARINGREYEPENLPLAVENPRVGAAILDLGASRSFFRAMAALGVRDGLNPNDAELVIVSDAPYYMVEDSEILSQVKGWLGKKPVIGFGHGAAIVAKAAGGRANWMKFGDHGVNIPVKHAAGGRNEITVQNHNYEVQPGDAFEARFTNVHDGACEGFVCRSARVAGVNFVPGEAWFSALLASIGLRVEPAGPVPQP